MTNPNLIILVWYWICAVAFAAVMLSLDAIADWRERRKAGKQK